ncbi:MAG: CRTAC1 family protein [Myxococcales bacterium]|nr:CRTAC1 family protein [Myxococcales bacterium]
MITGSAAIGALAWCSLRPPPSVAPVDPPARARPPGASSSPAPEPPPAPEPSALRFVDVTESSGLRFRHVSGRSERAWVPEIMGPGITVLDVDGDGVDEVLFVNGRRWPQDVEGAGAGAEPPARARLFRRDGARYVDCTDERGLGLSAQGYSALAWDPDGDGDEDVFFATLTGLRAFINDGTGHYAEETGARGLAVDGWTSVLAPLDVDDDGDLDLFVGRYLEWSPEQEAELDCRPDGVRRDYCSPNLFPATSPTLLINDGRGRFTDGSAAAGLPLGATKALGALTVDLDEDGRLDLIVANDQVRTQVFLAPGDGTLVEEATRLGLVGTEGGAAYAGMGIDGTWSAAPGEGLCVGIGNFFGEPVTVHCRTDSSRPFLSRSGKLGLRGPTLPWVTFGLKWFDADLDGDDDLVIANGNVSDEERVAGIPFRQPLQVFEAEGGRLRDVSAEAFGPLADRRMLGRALAVLDLEGDGDLDVLVADNNGDALALENRSAPLGERVGLRLVGAAPNTAGVGATLTVTGGARTQRAWMHLTSSYYGQSTRTRVTGLGPAAGPVSVELRWPSGACSGSRAWRAGACTIVEDESLAPTAPPDAARARGLALQARASWRPAAARTKQAVALLRDAIADEDEDPSLHRGSRRRCGRSAAPRRRVRPRATQARAASTRTARCGTSPACSSSAGCLELASAAVERALTTIERPLERPAQLRRHAARARRAARPRRAGLPGRARAAAEQRVRGRQPRVAAARARRRSRRDGDARAAAARAAVEPDAAARRRQRLLYPRPARAGARRLRGAARARARRRARALQPRADRARPRRRDDRARAARARERAAPRRSPRVGKPGRGACWPWGHEGRARGLRARARAPPGGRDRPARARVAPPRVRTAGGGPTRVAAPGARAAQCRHTRAEI